MLVNLPYTGELWKRTYHWPKDAEAYHLFRSPLVYVTTLCLPSGAPAKEGNVVLQQRGFSGGLSVAA